MLIKRKSLDLLEIHETFHWNIKILLMDIFLKEKICKLHPLFFVVGRRWDLG